MSKSSMSRRNFVKTAAGAAAAITIVPRHVLGGQGFQAPSDTLNIGGVGCGGKGTTDLLAMKGENVAALCDIDFKRAADSAETFPNAKHYKDFRVMLDKEPGLDAITVSTPDHLHAFIALEAMRRGKHVFCQKPLTRTLQECRKMIEVARDTGVVTQMGNQGHAEEGTRQIREWLEAGLIGEVREIEYWTNRPIWPQALDRPTAVHAPPDHVDWDLWLGPVADRPYHPDYYHPFNWRGWWDFGTGALGDIACHSMDAGFWTYDLTTPSEIVAETTRLYEETAPAASRITYDFPASNLPAGGSQPPIRVVWRDGELKPPRREMFDGPEWPGMTSGQMFVGSKGLLMADIYGQNPTLYPKHLDDEVRASPPAPKYPRTAGCYQEWIDACKGKGACGSNIADHAGPLTEMVLLGNFAVRTGEIIRWDPKKMTSGSTDADRLIGAEYREGWKL